MDLNHIFLFVAIISPLLVLARAWHPGSGFRGWRIAAIVVLVVTTIAWFLNRPSAGYVGGAVWFLALFLPAIGLKKVTELFNQRRYRAATNLAVAIYPLHPSADLRRQIQVFRSLDSQLHPPPPTEVRFPNQLPRSNRPNPTPAVLFLIAANAIVFAIEFMRGGIDNVEVLHQLGALDTYSVVIAHQYWRLLTALFLHYNLIHLGFNLFALYVLGPPLERTIGTLRFVICYFISGLGSSAGVVILTLARIAQPGELVGASGCIMGIVGGWAGFLLRHRHAPRARQRLLNVLMIVVTQTAFDLSTPQISMAAHVCGLVTGFVIGLLLAPKAAI